MSAWFGRKSGRIIAELEEKLKAESQARAEAEEKLRAEIETKAALERKVKAEAEKLLLAQYNKYRDQVEETKAKAEEEVVTARAQIKGAEEKVRSYEVALAEAQEKLNETQEQLKAEALARAEAEEKLKSEIEEQKRIEAQAEEAIATTKAKAEAKVQSHEVALTESQGKPTGNKGQIKAKAVTKAKAISQVDIQERRRLFEQPIEGIYILGQSRRNIFHLGDMKRKFVLLLVLGIFSALTFALSVANSPPVTEPGDIKVQEKTSERVSSVEGDTDREQLISDAEAESSLGSVDEPASGTTDAPLLKNESPEKVTLKVDEEKSVPTSDARLLVIATKPKPLILTASAGGKSNIIQSSDDNRLETRIGSSLYYEFSDVSVPANAAIKSVVLFVEHFEEERFAEGKLEWTVGTGWPDRPAAWAEIKAPVYKGQSNESVDAWDITSVVDTVEKINSLQLQIKNNNRGAYGKTLVDYVYVVIEYN